MLPLDGTAGRVLNLEPFPGASVQGAVEIDSKLYVALAFAYLNAEPQRSWLVSFDLKSDGCETLASSDREEHLSPFDDGEPWATPFMLADPPRHRILFLATAKDLEAPRRGLWEYDVAAKHFRQFRMMEYVGYPASRSTEIRGTPVVNGRFLLKDGPESIVYDLATDRVVIGRESELAPLLPLPDPAPVYFSQWIARYGRYRQGDGTLDQRTGSCRALWRLPAGMPPFARILPGGKLLTGDETGLWLLTLAPSATIAPRASPAPKPDAWGAWFKSYHLWAMVDSAIDWATRKRGTLAIAGAGTAALAATVSLAIRRRLDRRVALVLACGVILYVAWLLLARPLDKPTLTQPLPGPTNRRLPLPGRGAG